MDKNFIVLPTVLLSLWVSGLVGCDKLNSSVPTGTLLSPSATTSSPSNKDIDAQVEGLSGLGISTPSPIPSATSLVLTLITPSSANLNLEAVPSADEVLGKYPKLQWLKNNLDLSDEKQLPRLIAALLIIYQNDGLEALQQVLLSYGILEKLKLDSAYIDLLLALESEGAQAAKQVAEQRGLLTTTGEMQMLLLLDTQDIQHVALQLKALGMHIEQQRDNEVLVTFPLDALLQKPNEEVWLFLIKAAHLEHVLSIQLPTHSYINDLSASEGVKVSGADVWHKAGILGQGIRIGIIDPEGFGGFRDLMGSALPSKGKLFIPPQISAEQLDLNSGTHGTSCAEIIHQMAPQADLYLVYEGDTSIGFESAVQWLLQQKVHIISHSGVFLGERIDGQSNSAKLIQQTLEQGTLWVNSAGNYALTHFLMTYNDEDKDGYHEFQPGREMLQFIPSEGNTGFALNWDDAWQGSKNNYDLHIYKKNAKNGQYQLVVSSRNLQMGRSYDRPLEALDYQFNPNQLYYIAIKAAPHTTPRSLNLIASAGKFDLSMPQSSLASPADAEASLTVGATFWKNDLLEYYSSQGPTLDGRIKPDIAAPAGVKLFSDTYFYGTSAAAPHVAGAAALVWSAFPDATPSLVRQYLLEHSIPLHQKEKNNQVGFGRLSLPADKGSLHSIQAEQLTISQVRLVPQTNIAGLDGLAINLSFTVKQFKGQEGLVEATFFSQPKHKPLQDTNGSYTQQDGLVAVQKTFLAKTDNYSQELALFIPYQELEMEPGEHSLQCQLSFFNLETRQPLIEPVRKEFVFTQAESKRAYAVMQTVSGVIQYAEKGVSINTSFQVYNLRNQAVDVAAYFFWAGEENLPLKDFNNHYRSKDGNAAAVKTFTPKTQNDNVKDFKLFFPYTELHLESGKDAALKFLVVLWEQETQKQLARSAWNELVIKP